MRISKWMAVPAALVAATALSVNIEAAPKTNKASGPKTTKTTKTTTTSSPKGKTTSTGEVSKAKGPKTKTTTTTASNSSSTKKSSASTKKNASSTTTSTETTPTTTTTTGTGTTWEPTNAVAEKLMGKPNQLAKAKAVIGDVDINLATDGFKNFGQFNAAVNASQNLGIEFADLKAAMTGITVEGDKTNEPTKSLGQAIKQYRPGVDAEAEAALATSQAAQ
jgi:hypothetical protein